MGRVFVRKIDRGSAGRESASQALVFCCEENEVCSGEIAHFKCDAGALFMAHQEIEVLTSVDDDDGRQKMPSQHLRFISQC